MIEEYMERLKLGEENALDSIYNKTKKLVFSICLSYVKDYMLAEDMMQDTYINVVKYIKSYKKNTNPEAWICTIAKNLCLNEIKKNKKIEYGDYAMEVADNQNDNSTPLIDIAIKILKDSELRILLPHIIDDRKFVDIAHDLKMSEGTVRWKYNNALNKIRKYVERSNYETN